MTATFPVVGIMGGYTFLGQAIDEGNDHFKEKYATERGWYDPSDKNK